MADRITIHRIYVGNKVHGGHLKPFAKCLCGAELHGTDAIEEHAALEEEEETDG